MLMQDDLKAIHEEAEIAQLVSAVLRALLDEGSKHAAVEALLVLAGDAQRHRAWQESQRFQAELGKLLKNPVAAMQTDRLVGSRPVVHATDISPEACPTCRAERAMADSHAHAGLRWPYDDVDIQREQDQLVRESGR